MGWKYRKLISSDSHVNEPEDLYWNSLGTTFGERTPLRVISQYYMRNRIWHGFIDDEYALDVLSHVGVSQLLWGSDFPHIRSDGLEAQEHLAGLLKGLPMEDQEKLAGENTAEVFRV